jgi:hypothetical protein
MILKLNLVLRTATDTQDPMCGPEEWCLGSLVLQCPPAGEGGALALLSWRTVGQLLFAT